MTIVARGEVALSPDLRGFESSLKGAIAGAVGGVGAAVGAALAGLKIGSFVKGAVGDAIDLTEATNRVKVVFGEAAAEALKLGENAPRSLLLSRLEAISAVGDLGNLLTSMGLNQQAAVGMSTSLIKLSADIASFNNVGGGATEVLAAFRSGLVGESEPLRRFGITISEEAIQAKAAELGLIKLDGAHKKAASSANSIAKAVEHLGDVQRDTGERIEDLQRSIADRAVAAADRIISANQRVEVAEERLADVQRASVDAQKRLTDARIDARRRLDELSFAVGDNALRQRQANLNIKKAIADQQRVNADAASSSLDRQQAELDVAQARRDAAETARASASEERELNDAQKKGVDGSEAVQGALQGIAASERDLRDARKERSDALLDVTAAELEAARGQADSARELARAQGDAARDISQAQRSISEAATSAADAIQKETDSITPSIRAQALLALALDQSKNAQGDLARTINDPANRIREQTGRFANLREEIGERLLPVYVKLLDFLETKILPFLENKLIPGIDRVVTKIREFAESDLGQSLGSLVSLVAAGMMQNIEDVVHFVELAVDQIERLFSAIVTAYNNTLGRIPGFDKLDKVDFSSGERFVSGDELDFLGGRAHGGPVGPGSYVVGEQGPEILELGAGSRGRVYSNDQSRSMGSTFHIYDNTGDPEHTAAAVSARLGRSSQR